MIGTVIGGYRVDGKLGEGGMGEVFSATHELMGKRVAIKVLRLEHSQNTDVVTRFFKEARAATLLNHPGCVDIIDTGRLADGRGYIVMELLEGESLKDRMTHGRLPVAVTVAIARQVADVLQTAHSKGIIHRDLKPENIMVTPDETEPSGARVKVLDFGVAKLTEGGQQLTNPNAIIGTPAYMAPEQCKGARFVEARSDIYSLGCVLYEMICGRAPFVCKGFGDYLMAHLTQAVPPPSSLGPVDARLEAIILRALAKEPTQRQASMAEVIAELDALNLARVIPRDAAATVRAGDVDLAKLRALGEEQARLRAAARAQKAAGGAAPASSSRLIVLVILVVLVTAGIAAGAMLFFFK